MQNKDEYHGKKMSRKDIDKIDISDKISAPE